MSSDRKKARQSIRKAKQNTSRKSPGVALFEEIDEEPYIKENDIRATIASNLNYKRKPVKIIFADQFQAIPEEVKEGNKSKSKKKRRSKRRSKRRRSKRRRSKRRST